MLIEIIIKSAENHVMAINALLEEFHKNNK
ncbi:hypothetical protein CLHOM_34770 [Clostridium homopropionicum DSM 5847]|uniref:Uncharacterized protein n=1 Tax=Clostridium homopropionicum DSM 5847 TaxID=1121318 RepID=A0A0L6Z6I9_9CLOT|nr:hypothetical protein CLHOM_34770 [Clostridium homopropionicum DSM 5847]